MSASWIRQTVHDGPTELWPRVTGLADFPSERDEPMAEALTPPAHRPPGVTMRVARISPGVALGLALVLLLGSGTAALIGLLATGRADWSTSVLFASVLR